MRVAVTGAAGFLGREVVRSLRDAGHDVIALVRSAGSVEPGPGVEVRRCDLRTDDLTVALEDAEVVVHCAAQVTGSDEARFASTVVGTEKLLGAIDPRTVTRLVHVSSYSVYDWTAATGVLDESSPTADSPYRRDGYAVAKVWQERLVRDYAERESAVDVTILRPGFVWGPGNEDLAGAGIPVGPALLVVGPSSRLPLTYVSNCADAVATAVDRKLPSGTVLNVVDGPGITAWSYAGRLVAWDPALRWRIPVPYAAFNALVAILAVVMPRLFRHGGKLPGIFMRAPFHARFRPLRHTGSRAQHDLGWRPRVDVQEALRRTFGSGSRA